MLPFLIPLITSGISAIGGALSNRKKQQTSTTTPTLDPAFGPLQTSIIDRAMQRFQQPSALPPGFASGGIKTINDTFNTGRQSLENVLSARGLGTSPVAGSALTQHETGRIGEISGFRRNLPLLERDLQNQDMEQAMRLIGQGRGLNTTATTPGNMVGGGISDMATMLGFLYGQGAFGRGQGAPVSATGLPNMYMGF